MVSWLLVIKSEFIALFQIYYWIASRPFSFVERREFYRESWSQFNNQGLCLREKSEASIFKNLMSCHKCVFRELQLFFSRTERCSKQLASCYCESNFNFLLPRSFIYYTVSLAHSWTRIFHSVFQNYSTNLDLNRLFLNTYGCIWFFSLKFTCRICPRQTTEYLQIYTTNLNFVRSLNT